MYLAVINVKPIEDYQLALTFENGEKRIFDMKPYLDKGIYKELRDESKFKTVRISFDSIEWCNQADIDPEFLYGKSVEYILQ
jgi:CTP:phosphocholine cytidylyltransferase-like protein